MLVKLIHPVRANDRPSVEPEENGPGRVLDADAHRHAWQSAAIAHSPHLLRYIVSFLVIFFS